MLLDEETPWLDADLHKKVQAGLNDIQAGRIAKLDMDEIRRRAQKMSAKNLDEAEIEIDVAK